MVEVLVEHDYIAKESNELSLTKGDIIKDVIKRQGGWWEGTLGDKTGLFPDNFVRVLDKDSVVMRNRKDASRIRQCRVVFSYKQDHEDELNLNVGDVIEILGEEEEGWWRGVLNGKQGVFPSNFVEEIAPKSKTGSRESLNDIHSYNESVRPTKTAKTICEVKFPYKAQNEDELTLNEGDLLVLLSKDGQDPGWWKGELNGQIGVFPDNFVSIVTPSTEKSEKKPNKSITNEPLTIKPSSIVSQQRRSQEIDKVDHDLPTNKTTPPVPSKKPSIPLKKSPSGSGGTAGGILAGFKKKLVDVMDGAAGSKVGGVVKTEAGQQEVLTDNEFDDVVRRPLLADVRASRPKAPGRRLPSVVFKDSEPGVVNGNSDPIVMEALSQPPQITPAPDNDAADGKPKLREWEKHKAPWLAEMKLNQAKRTSTSPGPPENKPKSTPPPPPEKQNNNNETAAEDAVDKTPSLLDKSIEKPVLDKLPINSRLKTPPHEAPVLRSNKAAPPPVRPQTIQNVVEIQKPPFHPKMSPLRTPSPLPPKVEGSKGEVVGESGAHQQQELLVQRIGKLEELVEKQQKALEDVLGKLQIEIEMRMQLQAKVEHLLLDDAIQQI